VTYLPTAEHDELRAVVRELAEERIAPRAAEIDEKSEFPWDLKELLAQQDLLGTCFEERHGGTDLDTIAQSIIVEEIARADATTSLIPSSRSSVPCPSSWPGATSRRTDTSRASHPASGWRRSR
jgi:alkylation response protein AidB-like acyl-CoA dehydrogenase